MATRKRKGVTAIKKAATRPASDDAPARGTGDLCCCPPRAHVWIDHHTDCCAVENRIDMQRRLQVHADAHSSMRPPAGPDADSESVGGSKLDEGTLKPQGKVYRTSVYTVHWRAVGACRPLAVALSVHGEIVYEAQCLPEEGQVTVSASAMLEPPDYGPPPGPLFATVTVRDCAGHQVSCTNQAPHQA